MSIKAALPSLPESTLILLATTSDQLAIFDLGKAAEYVFTDHEEDQSQSYRRNL
jgi:hypothetical protein